jgi:bacterioferritin-associated ferredoxin
VYVCTCVGVGVSVCLYVCTCVGVDVFIVGDAIS